MSGSAAERFGLFMPVAILIASSEVARNAALFARSKFFL